jgi:transcriptional regulator GlxA family with amidase domain
VQLHQRRTAVAGATNEIGIVLYPGVQAACVHGLTDLFEIAANVARDRQQDGRFRLRVTHWKPIHCGAAKLSCVYDSARIVDHGDIITAGGFLAWVDLGLFLVDRILGPAIGRRRRTLFFPAQPRLRRDILQALLLLRRMEIEPC